MMTQADQKRITKLIDRLNAGTITDEDKQALEQWFKSIYFTDVPLLEENDEAFGESLKREYSEVIAKVRAMQRRRKLLRLSWRVAAAAVLLFGLGVLWQQHFQKTHIISLSVVHNDVPPGGTKARLILANGNIVQLNDNGDSVFLQGKVQVRQANGRITYQSAGKEKETAYNTLITPNGGQYAVTLADGTKVWLNAESSLTYPVAFAGSERKVTITGEAYFEVVHHEKMPFKVQVENEVIEDLGTQFNVNAYADEPVIKTALLEGSVKVSLSSQSADQGVKLQPGEQATLDKEGQIHVVKSMNIKDAVAWKNGYFQFQNDSISTIMRQAARWYNVDISYHGNISQLFTGKVPRNVNISTLLNILESTGWVHFSIKNREIVVGP
jgi:ferric-dicitrate binding protein FerR (iron transport regulator)